MTKHTLPPRPSLGRWIHIRFSHLKSICTILANAFYDAVRVIRHTHFWCQPYTRNQIDAKLWSKAHVIEKGMSLPEPRIPYGEKSVRELADLCRAYRQNGFPDDGVAICNAISIIQEHEAFHRRHGWEITLPPELSADKSNDDNAPRIVAGIHEFTRDSYRQSAKGSFAEMAASRSSFRAFTGESINPDDVRKALDIARKTPSACNRQSWRCHWIRNRGMIDEVRALQSGNRGFGEKADSFLAITADISAYGGAKERNQTYVDGGMFAMSVLYGLHFVGIGACPLNWSVTGTVDRALRRVVPIPDNENVVMLIAIGALPKTVRVARSTRIELSSVLFEIAP